MRTMGKILYVIVAFALTLGLLGVSFLNPAQAQEKSAKKPKREKPSQHFQTSDRCIACHNGRGCVSSAVRPPVSRQKLANPLASATSEKTKARLPSVCITPWGITA